MKKKLLGFVAFAMAMTMTTTSAFAAIGPRARGTGDVDGDGIVTANDVLKILKGLANEDAEADVDGNAIVESKLDAAIAYKTVLQPKTVTEDLVLNIYATEGINGNINILDAGKLGASVTAGDKGMNEVNVTSVDSVSTASTIKDAISEAVAAAAINNTAVTNQINKIKFTSAVKGEVSLRSENGWSMFCNALRYIVPMDEATAALCNKAENANYDGVTNKDRYDALNEVKAILVGEQTDPAAVNETELSYEDIIAIKDAFFVAIPPTVTSEEITNTAKEVLAITDTKYDFTIEYNDHSELLKSDSVESTQFLQDIISIAQYDTKTMADYRNTFGDKVVFTAKNQVEGATPITAVLEVAEIAE